MTNGFLRRVFRAIGFSASTTCFHMMQDMLSKVPKAQFGDVFASLKGSTGTLLNAAATEEKYVITWTSTKTQIYELPTGVCGRVLRWWAVGHGVVRRPHLHVRWLHRVVSLYSGGAAEMDEGENIMFFARKEQCLALGAQLRTAFKPRIDDFKIYRMFPNGEVQYLHPKDGVFPEKVCVSDDLCAFCVRVRIMLASVALM